MNNVNWIVLGVLIVLGIWVLYMAYESNPPPPPPKEPVVEPPPPSAYVEVGKFLEPNVNLTPSSGTDAKLTVVSGRTMGYIPSAGLGAMDDVSVSVSGPSSIPITEALSIPILAEMAKMDYERNHPEYTLEFEVGEVVDHDSIDVRFRYMLNGVFHHVDAQRYNFTRDGSRIVYQGSDGKNTGLYVLPLNIMDQYSPEELWDYVKAYYINLHGTNALFIKAEKLGNMQARYEFMDSVYGLQNINVTFERSPSGSIVVRNHEDVEINL